MIHCLHYLRYIYDKYCYGLDVKNYRNWLYYDYTELLKRLTLAYCDNRYFKF